MIEYYVKFKLKLPKMKLGNSTSSTNGRLLPKAPTNTTVTVRRNLGTWTEEIKLQSW